MPIARDRRLDLGQDRARLLTLALLGGLALGACLREPMPTPGETHSGRGPYKVAPTAEGTLHAYLMARDSGATRANISGARRTGDFRRCRRPFPRSLRPGARSSLWMETSPHGRGGDSASRRIGIQRTSSGTSASTGRSMATRSLVPGPRSKALETPARRVRGGAGSGLTRCLRHRNVNAMPIACALRPTTLQRACSHRSRDSAIAVERFSESRGRSGSAVPTPARRTRPSATAISAFASARRSMLRRVTVSLAVDAAGCLAEDLVVPGGSRPALQSHGRIGPTRPLAPAAERQYR